ncbi:hypothetical protein D3C87_1901530 [compost metagenome]
MLIGDGKINNALYNLKKDRLTKNNIVDQEPAVTEKMNKYLRAFIQQYNNRMIENKLTAK